MSVIIFQDTCTGFLLGGIGELNKKREPNFLVVDKSKNMKLTIQINEVFIYHSDK